MLLYLMLYQQQTLLNKESKYKCFIIKQVPRCTLWRSDNTSGVTGNKLRSYYKRNNMVLPNEWFKLHYLYRKANNILWERAAVINEAHGWKYVKYLSWEKSTSHPFLIFESSRWPLLLSISAFLFITGLWYTLKNDGSLFPHGLLALSTLLYFKFSWINDLQKESNEGGMTIRVLKPYQIVSTRCKSSYFFLSDLLREIKHIQTPGNSLLVITATS
mgnify:CR=1 FL=1